MERTGLLYDVHVPYEDQNAFNKALYYLASRRPKPTRIILAGDFADFKDISFFKDDPNRMAFKDELEAVKDSLSIVRNHFPKSELIYLEGNHEARLNRFLFSNAPQLSGISAISVPDLLELNKFKCQYIDNIKLMNAGRQPYKLGKLFVLHGHEKKVSFGAINLAKLYYDKCHTNVIAGHHHRPDKKIVRLLNGKYEGAWTVGCLCQLSEPYSPINDWMHGWAFVDVYDNGIFEVYNKGLIEGNILNV